MSVIEHFCTKHIHPAARNIVTPLVELVITVPVSFLVFGPIFSALQAAIGNGYTALYNLSPVVTGIVLGAAWQILVVFGLHWGIVPLGQVNLAMYGRNTINAVTGPSNWAQAGSAMGVALRTKNPDVKETAMSAAITGIFSITEPAIYGVTLRLKKPFVCGCVGGAIGLNGAASLPAVQVSANKMEGVHFVGGVIGANLPQNRFEFDNADGTAAPTATIGTGSLVADGVAGGIIGYNAAGTSLTLTNAVNGSQSSAQSYGGLARSDPADAANGGAYIFYNGVPLGALDPGCNGYFAGGIIGYNCLLASAPNDLTTILPAVARDTGLVTVNNTLPRSDKEMNLNGAAISYLDFLGIESGFTQDFTSATEDYTPDFSLEGLE